MEFFAAPAKTALPAIDFRGKIGYNETDRNGQGSLPEYRGTDMKNQWKILPNILLGNALLAFAICAFVVPNDFMLGGANGIALGLQQFLPLKLSVLTALVNGTLFFVGLIFMGWQFAAASLASTVIYPCIMAVFELLPLGTLFSEDPLVCAIFCALTAGLGIGLVVRAGGSTGGMDIPPCILYKYKGIPVGKSMFVFDVLVVLVQVCIRGTIDGLLYSIMIVIVMSTTVDRVVISGEKTVQITVISPQTERIRKEILEDLDCGVTLLNVETGFDRKAQQAVYSVVYANKYPQIRDAVLAIDPHAFIVAGDVKNVNGRGYTLDRGVRS